MKLYFNYYQIYNLISVQKKKKIGFACIYNTKNILDLTNIYPIRIEMNARPTST